VGTAVYAAGVRAGQTVVIFGPAASGPTPSGGQVRRAAHVIGSTRPFKRENAFAFGATHVFARATGPGSRHRADQDSSADHALITIGVLSSEVVEQAAAISGRAPR